MKLEMTQMDTHVGMYFPTCLRIKDKLVIYFKKIRLKFVSIFFHHPTQLR